jgi:hypothetical protein
MKTPRKSRRRIMKNVSTTISAICLSLITVFIGYGGIFKGFLEVPKKVNTIEEGIKELLQAQGHRIFTVVPEKRVIEHSNNPRRFEVEISPNAVKKPVTFEFDQKPLMPLPGAISPDYEFLGWSVVFGPETLKFIQPFTARVELESEEKDVKSRLGVLRWSKDEMKWHAIPISIERDRITAEWLLRFDTKDPGWYSLSLKKHIVQLEEAPVGHVK